MWDGGVRERERETKIWKPVITRHNKYLWCSVRRCRSSRVHTTSRITIIEIDEFILLKNKFQHFPWWSARKSWEMPTIKWNRVLLMHFEIWSPGPPGLRSCSLFSDALNVSTHYLCALWLIIRWKFIAAAIDERNRSKEIDFFSIRERGGMEWWNGMVWNELISLDLRLKLLIPMPGPNGAGKLFICDGLVFNAAHHSCTLIATSGCRLDQMEVLIKSM